MDILTHTLSGLAVGTVAASFSKKGWKNKSAIIVFSGLGGALPDIDAISMWSRFDGTFGRLFGLSMPGRDIYSAKLWYSHHSFMHSLLAAVLIAAVIGILFWIFQRNKNRLSLPKIYKEKHLLLIGFIMGFIVHLVQDMITPGGSWGGVRLFFPSEIYIGGTGSIWWWNSYNLFLVVVSVLVINLILLLIFRKPKSKPWRYAGTVFLIGCIVFVLQMKRIDYNFNGKKYADCEQKSKDIQKEILGERVYRWMEKLDNLLIIHF